MQGLMQEIEMRILLFVFSIFFFGCDPAVQYARTKYPGCDVERISEGTVRVECPGKDPFEKRFTKR